MTKNEIEVLENLEKTYREAVKLICKFSEKEPDKGRKALCAQLKSNCEQAAKLTVMLKGKNTEEQSLENLVTKYLLELGVPANINGYSYLRTAILLAIEDNSILKDITKGLYVSVAKQHGTTGSRVERGIRYAIERSYTYTAGLGMIDEIFGRSISIEKLKPTNSAYIAGIADYVLQNHKFA